MPTLDHIFTSSPGTPTVGDAHAVNPFADQDALTEAQVIEIRYSGITSTLGILLEMRLADQIRTTSTALIVAASVSIYSWQQTDRNHGRTAWTIIRSTPKRTPSGLTLELVTSPSALLSFTAHQASFYSLLVDSLEKSAPPDYVDQTMPEILSAVPRWSSEVQVAQASHFL